MNSDLDMIKKGSQIVSPSTKIFIFLSVVVLTSFRQIWSRLLGCVWKECHSLFEARKVFRKKYLKLQKWTAEEAKSLRILEKKKLFV